MYKIYTTKPCWVDRHVPKILLIMKLITVLLIATMMQVSAASFAQKLTLKKDNISLEQLFKEIRKQTGYAVIYTAATIKDSKAINADFQNTPIEEVLTTSLKDQSLKFEIDTKNIIITKAPATFLESLGNSWADGDIRGRVVDEQGNPLPNATIRIKGKEAVINTNEKGEFVIMDIEDDAVLVISYVGYNRLEILVKGAIMPLEIKLNQVTGELEEVSVSYSTGYQNIPKERATGSFVQIDNELFNRKVGTNVLDRILEVTSGLIKRGIDPSPRVSGIQIRGNSTINGSKAPLIVLDNFIYEGDLNNLNPNDIENITVLKDAAAASIWGVRAGNGVIVITTKKGKFSQSNKIAFNSNITIGKKPDLDYVKTMSSKDWMEFEKKRFADSVFNTYDDRSPSRNSFPILSQGVEILLAARKKNKNIVGYNALNDPLVNHQLDELSKYNVKDDISKYLLQNSINQQYALNASGGGNKYFYYTSIGFDRNHSNNVRDENSRFTLNFNNTYRLFKNLELNSFLSYVQANSKNNGLSSTSFLPTGGSSITAPYTRLADENGNALAVPVGYRIAYVDTASFPGLLDWHYRPLDELRNNNNESKQFDTRIAAGVKYTITSGLNANVRYQFQRALTNLQSYRSQETYFQRDQINTFMIIDPFSRMISTPYPMGDFIDKRHLELKNWNFRSDLGLDRNYGKHAISAIVGIEFRETKTSLETNKLYGFDPNTSLSILVNPTVRYPDRFGRTRVIGGGPTIDGSINRFASYFANASYSFMERYTASVSGRADQGNFFGLKANQRISPLWSAGLVWDISKEGFYSLKFLPNLKLRATYGFNGNTNGGSAFATAGFSEQNYPYPSQYAYIITPNNPELRWERVKQINYALDFSTKNNRISGSIEYYTKKGIDLIGPILTDPTVGVESFEGNRASIKGKGLDLVLNSQNIKGKFKWQSNFLLSYNTDEVINYERKITSTQEYLSITPVVGKPLRYLYSYKWGGLDPMNGTARLYLADTISNNTNYDKANLSDLVYHGSSVPTIFGSIRNTLNYNQLSLSFNITYRLGYYFRRTSVAYQAMFNVNSGWGGHSDYVKRWQMPGDEKITDVPAMLPSSFFDQRDAVYSQSDILVEKGDHIRLQDIRLDYTLSRSKFKKLPFQHVQFYLYGNNIGILWTRNKHGIDPDYASFGFVPASRTISAGLNVTF
jgi:TonB-linked SusC/RagA family outer membrane protein